MTRTVFGSDTVTAVGQHIDSALLIVAVVALVLVGLAAVVAGGKR